MPSWFRISSTKDIVYSVRVGVYRQPYDVEKRYGLNDLYTNKTSGGLIKYLYGTHKGYPAAVAAKEEAVGKGVTDAFIVAFQNGARISLADAIKATGKGSISTSKDNRTTNELLADVKTGGSDQLIYTVQVGVYLKPTDLGKKHGLKNIYTISGDKGTIKYCYGKYYSYGKAAEAKSIPVTKGVTDAFVTAYYNGKRITIAQAKTIEVTSGAKPDQIKSTPTNSGNTTKDNTTQGEQNGFYTVKIGEYGSDIPIEEAKAFFDLKELGIDRIPQESSTIYTVGNFKTFEEAETMKRTLIR